MDILGIGNALLDILSFSDDETALFLGLHPNHAAHVSPERLDELLLAVNDPIYVSGGSASNAVKAASALGSDTAFIGCIGTDDRDSDRWAVLFREDLAAFGVECVLEKRNAVSGRCLVIRMPGGLKAIACAPGAASTIRPEQIESAMVARAKTVLIDGQVLRNKAVTDRIANLCKGFKVPLALDISTGDIARDFGAETLEILIHNDCILFVNSSEALTLARALEHTIPGDRGIRSEEQLVDSVFSFYTTRKNNYPIIIEKRAENGAKAWTGGEKHDAGTVAAPHVLDDTGAGDVFAGAFLRAFLVGKNIGESLSFANRTAREALSVPGTRLDRDAFSALKSETAR